ncbi:hypothetical protein GCM10022221_55860 [Actinocorallia aurea]
MLVPGYELSEALGQGGFGTVYRATQLAVGRQVALKVDGRVLATERDRRRFMREVQTAGRLSGHAHVVAVYDAGVLADGRPYLVMELCPNGSLADRLAKDGPLPVGEVRAVGVAIADALAAAHGAGILHRDLKPANILIDRYGNVGLADFGLAAEQAPGLESSVTRNALTPAFASPEAFRQEEPSAAGDVYSLGATLYALLRGRPPHFPEHGTPSLIQLAASITRPVPPLAHVPTDFNDLLGGALSYDAAARPTAAELRDALASLALDARPEASHAADPHPTARDTFPVSPSPQATPSFPEARTDPDRDSDETVEARRGGRLGVVFGAASLVVALAALGGVGYVVLEGRGTGGTASEGGSGVVPPDDPGALGGGLEGDGAEAEVFPEEEVGQMPALIEPQTTGEACGATALHGSAAECTVTAECWAGVAQTGDERTAGLRSCDEPHTWETFAVGKLPKGVGWKAGAVDRSARIRAICAEETLDLVLTGKGRKLAKPAQWRIEVLPPSEHEYGGGIRSYRCLAGIGLDELTFTVTR